MSDGVARAGHRVRGLAVGDVRLRLAGRAATPPAARHAAVAIVLCGDEADPAVCFVQRASRAGDRWSGDVAFPGGWHSSADPDPRGTAIRETAEEIALALGHHHHLGDLAPMPINRDPSRTEQIVASVFYLGREAPPLRPDGREIVDAFWVRCSHLHDPVNRTTVDWSRSEPRVPRPGIRFGERVIWGLTYRVLTRFAAAVGRDDLLDPDGR